MRDVTKFRRAQHGAEFEGLIDVLPSTSLDADASNSFDSSASVNRANEAVIKSNEDFELSVSASGSTSSPCVEQRDADVRRATSPTHSDKSR